ncbi:MAG: hypothetical protein ABIY37_09900 [Devosia sp.]
MFSFTQRDAVVLFMMAVLLVVVPTAMIVVSITMTRRPKAGAQKHVLAPVLFWLGVFGAITATPFGLRLLYAYFYTIFVWRH